MRKLLLLLLLASPVFGQGSPVIGNMADSLPNYAADPYTCSATVTGHMYFDTVNAVAKICDGSSWSSLAAGATVDGITFELTGIADGQVPCYDGTTDNRMEPCDGGILDRADDDGTVALLASDRGRVVTVAHATANAVSIAQAGTAGFADGYYTTLCTEGAGISTITPTTSTIKPVGGPAAANYKSKRGDCVEIRSDGLSYLATVKRTMTPISFEGVCQNTTASFSLDTPTSNAPAAACITGSNIVNRGVIDFDAATDETVYGSFWLSDNWGGVIDLDVEALANEASTNVARLQISTICVGASETFDPAFNSAQGFNWTGTGTANQRVVASQASLTVTGCAAGERFFFKFNRDADGTSGTDSLGVDLRVVALRFWR